MALEFLEFMTQRNIVGIFQKWGNHYLLVFSNVEGSLKLAYCLTHIIGEKLRTMEIPQRISYDNKKPAILQGKGKGKGKAQDGNKGRGKGKGKAQEGNKGGKGKNRSRSPRHLSPVGAAPPVDTQPRPEAAGPRHPQASG